MTQSSILRDANLVGAFAVTLVDCMADAIQESAGSFGSAPAAVLLIHHGHVRRIGDLRRPLRLTHAGTVRLVDRLERSGLVRRTPGAGRDLREVGIELTSEGSRMVARVLAAREQAIASLLGSLSADQAGQLARACESALAGAAASSPVPARLCRYCDEGACDLSRCPVETVCRGR